MLRTIGDEDDVIDVVERIAKHVGIERLALCVAGSIGPVSDAKHNRGVVGAGFFGVELCQ